MDGEDSPDNNMEERVEEFVEFVEEQSQHYLTNNILVTMGEDFQYQAGVNIPPQKKVIQKESEFLEAHSPLRPGRPHLVHEPGQAHPLHQQPSGQIQHQHFLLHSRSDEYWC